MKKITIAQVAEAAGVSIATASKALNGTDRIAADTVQHVYKTAEALGYTPNRAAQMLAWKNKSVGILLPETPEQIISLFRTGLTEALNGYSALNTVWYDYPTFHGSSEFVRYLKECRETLNGIVFLPGYVFSEEVLAQIAALPIPKVSLQQQLPQAVSPSVTVDEPTVGKMAAELLGLGTQNAKTAVISGVHTAPIHSLNLQGFSEEAERTGMRILSVLDSYDDFPTAYQCTDILLREHPELDGIFVSSYVAPAVCRCLCDRGMAGKIRVVGVDISAESAEYLESGVLTAAIYQNQKLQAHRAAELLLSMIRNPAQDRQNIAGCKIKPELVLRSTLHHYFP